MRKINAIKAVMCFASASLFLSLSTITVHAEEVMPIRQGVAGISYTLENYGENVITSKSIEEIISPLADVGVSITESYVNIRKEPNTDSEVMGKLYRGSAADILERLEGDWVKIKSGDVTGYIAANYLAIGKDAETMIDEYAKKYIFVTAKTLNVRKSQSVESKLLTQIPEGETYPVIKEYDEWAEILLGTDGNTGDDFTGFVSKEFVTVTVDFKYAISIEEENRIKKEKEKAEREAEQAEIERREKLEEEKARRAEEKRRAAEAEKANEEEEQEQDDTSYSGSSENASDIQNEIITYALKFVGYPYVWGGNSLTGGVDCSGFVKEIYEDFGYDLPRRSKDQAKYAGVEVNESNRQPGDLIFYTDSNGTVNHVAMYIGNNRVVAAASRREGIKTSQYNYRQVYKVRRIIH